MAASVRAHELVFSVETVEREGRNLPQEAEMAIDPVCKMQVDESKSAGTSEYNGKTYYFCAAVCKRKFDENPEKYVKS
jgi:YHS domain-containing protein